MRPNNESTISAISATKKGNEDEDIDKDVKGERGKRMESRDGKEAKTMTKSV